MDQATVYRMEFQTLNKFQFVVDVEEEVDEVDEEEEQEDQVQVLQLPQLLPVANYN